MKERSKLMVDDNSEFESTSSLLLSVLLPAGAPCSFTLVALTSFPVKADDKRTGRATWCKQTVIQHPSSDRKGYKSLFVSRRRRVVTSSVFNRASCTIKQRTSSCGGFRHPSLFFSLVIQLNIDTKFFAQTYLMWELHKRWRWAN